MKISSPEILRRLGAGETIDSVCEAASISHSDFQQWWEDCLAQRVPSVTGVHPAAVSARVAIQRDRWGAPHIHAENNDDLFFGFGYAMAQDRLFQLDYLRRKGSGRLAEILGAAGLEQDILARTVGLQRIAEAEWGRLPEETKSVLTAFSAGVNCLLEQSSVPLPIECDLLGYRPEPWSPLDSLVIECEFRWYLTGRFPVIVMPELAKQTLGEGKRYREYLRGEEEQEFILPPGTESNASRAAERLGNPSGGPDDGVGSNNWVVAGRHAVNGKPLVASDPHIAIEAVSCWYPAHLCGGSFNVAGMAYAGMPAIMFGRTERVAWGITNNICSQRDLYRERTDASHPGCFEFEGVWEPSQELTETIHVKDADPVAKTVRFSRNGPIVDEILPAAARQTGPVSLKWLGASQGGWLTSLLAMGQASDSDQFKAALRPWHVPTFSLVFADSEGHIGFKAAGRIPLRRREEQGYRNGWESQDQWEGLLPFEAMPEAIEPERGWMASANNPVASAAFPYPLSCTSPSGRRAKRIREMLEQRLPAGKLSRDDFRAMQQDTLSLRAVDCIPKLLYVLKPSDDVRVQSAAKILEQWNCRCETQEVGPTIYNVFFSFWAQAVASERFEGDAAELMAGGVEAVASRLLAEDPAGWFEHNDREEKIRRVFQQTLDTLTERLGADMNRWTWAKLHVMPLPHVLSSRGDLGSLLNGAGDGGVGVKGDMGTVCNTGCGPNWNAPTGGGYRMIVDLNDAPAGLWAIDAPSQSGHPGSPHYRDQLASWLAGEQHFLSLDHEAAAESTTATTTLEPK